MRRPRQAPAVKGSTAARPGEIARLAAEYGFFHWHLEFPEVFGAGGFSCVLVQCPAVRGEPVRRRGERREPGRAKGRKPGRAARRRPGWARRE